jgi:hypothetical protein
MRKRRLMILSLLATAALGSFAVVPDGRRVIENRIEAQAAPAATPIPAAFDQAAALAKLKEQIKGREQEPSEKVFKNIQTPFIKSMNAGRVLAVMEIAYARSLGVTCTHCHTPDRWEAEDKPQKQIARDMAAMMAKINSPELLRGVKNLKSPTPTINCTTCHRGETKPALNLPGR